MHKADLIWAIRYHGNWSAANGYKARFCLTEGLSGDRTMRSNASYYQALSAHHSRIALDLRLQLLEAAHG